MTKMNLVTGISAGVIVSTLILACTSSTSTPASPNNNDNPTPPGTTPVSAAPYPVCQSVYLGFTTPNAFATPATTSCSPAGQPTAGTADSHCAGQTPQVVNGASCNISPSDDAGDPAADASAPADDAASSADSGTPASDDAGAQPAPGPCGENGPDYGATMYGTSGDDDDCKYHVSYTASPICENNGTYFVVTASNLAGNGGPVEHASTFAELCLSDTHPAPAIDAQPPTGQQQVVEGPPGTYTIGPVQFDAPGNWTVRFHFNEFCCDAADDSPHGHAAFHVTVP